MHDSKLHCDPLTLITAPVTVCLCVAAASAFPLGSSLGLLRFSLSYMTLHFLILNEDTEKTAS